MIPNYNCGRFIGRAIDTVLAQTYQPIEVIAVDDGSTDESMDVLARYGSNIRVISQRNAGVSAARNTGVRESHGELVAFLDADDEWHAEKLEKQVALFDRPGVGLVYCGIEYIDEAGRPLGTNVSGRRGRVLKAFALLRGTVVLAGGSTVVVRRECFDEAGLFDLEMSTAADWDMWRRIACHYEVDSAREILMRYRLRRSSMHRNVDVFARDMLHAFSRMFADPAAKEVHRLRRRAYSRLYLTFSGSYLYAGDRRQCVAYAMRSIVLWPPSIGYIAAMPLRYLRRRFGEIEGEPPL